MMQIGFDNGEIITIPLTEDSTAYDDLDAACERGDEWVLLGEEDDSQRIRLGRVLWVR